MRQSTLIAVLLVAGLGWACPLVSQGTQDWTDRPDARAPAGVNEDALLAPGTFEARYSVEVLRFEGLKVGTEEIPAFFVLDDWDLAPLSMTTQRHEIELRAGFLDWFGASLKVPFHHTSTELASTQLLGTPSASGFGDIEAHALIGLHETWPYRAHLIAGVSLPTGSVDGRDRKAAGRRRRRPDSHAPLPDAARRRNVRPDSRSGVRNGERVRNRRFPGRGEIPRR